MPQMAKVWPEPEGCMLNPTGCSINEIKQVATMGKTAIRIMMVSN